MAITFEQAMRLYIDEHARQITEEMNRPSMLYRILGTQPKTLTINWDKVDPDMEMDIGL